jgi:integrase
MTHRPNRVFELVRAIFRWAVGRDLVTVDPTVGLSPPIRKEKSRDRDLSPDEIRRLWAALDKAPVRRTPRNSERDFPMTRPTALAIKLALVTGQRIGEVAHIAVSELLLNDEAPLWTIPGDRTKNGQPNRVPISPLARRLIADASELAGESTWLFPSPNGDGPIDAHAPTRRTSFSPRSHRSAFTNASVRLILAMDALAVVRKWYANRAGLARQYRTSGLFVDP